MAKPKTFSVNTKFIQETPMAAAAGEGIKNRASDINNAISYNLRFLALNEIVPNEKNSAFVQVDIEQLRDNILLNGLLHNLVVVLQDDGRYRLISGERRWRAIGLMTEEERSKIFPNGIPCHVYKEFGSSLEEEFAIVSANNETRSLDDDTKKYSINVCMEYINALKLKGEKVDVAKRLAEALNVSVKTATKYVKTTALIPELAKQYESGNITLNAAATYGGMSESVQEEVSEIIQNEGSVSEDLLASLQKKDAELKDFKQRILDLEERLEKKDQTIQDLNARISSSTEVSPTDKATLARIEKEKNKLTEDLANINKELREKSKLTTRAERLQRKKERIEKVFSELEKHLDYIEKNEEVIISDSALSKRYHELQKRMAE